MLKTLLDNEFPNDLKCCLTERPNIPTPEEDFEIIDVPGRDGALYISRGFKDIEIECEYNVLEETNIKPLIRKIKAFFVGKKTLRFSDDDVFYKINKISFDSISNEIENYGLFTVRFTVEPYQYQYNERVITLTKTGNVENVGSVVSNPYIRVYGSGTLRVNGKEIVIRDVTGYIELDSELGNAHKDGVDLNHHVNGKLPTLNVGQNKVEISGNIQKVEIDRRTRFI